MNPRSLVATGIRNALLTNTNLVTLITNEDDGQVRIYLQHADGLAVKPYVLMQHVFGGHLYRTPRHEIDALWTVSAVADDQPTAEEVNSLIYDTLDGTRPEFPDGYVADQDINSTGAIAELDTNQGVQAYKAGDYYRIRICKSNGV